MKTLPISEVLASATPLPWKITNIEADGHYDVEGNNGAALVASGAGFYGECQPQVANAALLAHAANMLPELVAAMENAAHLLADIVLTLDETGYPNERKLEVIRRMVERGQDYRRSTLSRARSVPMP